METVKNPKKLLINNVYWSAMGHSIEALRYSLGYHLANPDIEISLVLNEFTTTDLARLCPWIKNIYTVPISSDKARFPKNAVLNIPSEWDYLIADPRLKSTLNEKPDSFQKFHNDLIKHVLPTTKRGFMRDGTLPYKSNQQLELVLPDPNANVKRLLNANSTQSIKVVFLLAGGSYPRWFWPSLQSWKLILQAIEDSNDNVQFYLIGNNRKNNVNLKTRYNQRSADALLKNDTNIIDCRNLDLIEQLAIIKSSQLFVSPHTGFAFGAMAVGTPWLAISGGRWHEYFFNQVPFYSLLPNQHSYPMYSEKSVTPITDTDGTMRIPSMKENRFKESMSEISLASGRLTSGDLDYAKSMKRHLAKLDELKIPVEGFFDDADKV